ncbi:tol-pal system protein YbgF [soil metagenome]
MVTALLPLLAVGCARSAEERTAADLANDINEVPSDHDKFDQRFSSTEKDDIPPPVTGPSSTVATPPLRVIQLNPDGTAIAPSEGSGPTSVDDEAPRPVIKVQGVGGPKKGRNGTTDVIEQTLPDEAVGPAITTGGKPPSAIDPEAKRAYDAALALVNAKEWDKGLDAMAAFLVRYPDHPYAANATYWRGECYFAQGQFSRAAEQFEGILARFPLGGKTPDALLKLGICHQRLGNPAKAKTYFDKLQAEYPRSDAAKLIPSSTASTPPRGAGVQEQK